MTESDWLTCTNAETMLNFLERRASDTKLRRFALACCERVSQLISDPRHLVAVEAAQQFADGSLTEVEFTAALQTVIDMWVEIPDASTTQWDTSNYMTATMRHLESGDNAVCVARFASNGLAQGAGAEGSAEWQFARQIEEIAQCDLLGDLFGDPTRSFRFDAAWLSGAGSRTSELARQISRTGQFDSVRVLADEIERAGCCDQTVLDHCRGPGPHVPGCWVIDALLGRETAVCTGLISKRDWQECNDPLTLLHFLRDKGNARKWRLFAVSCCRRIWHLIVDERSRRAVEVAERYADSAATDNEREEARRAAREAMEEAHWSDYCAEADANFCRTSESSAATCRWLAAKAAHNAVCRDDQLTVPEPGPADPNPRRLSCELAEGAVCTNLFAESGSAHGNAGRAESCRIEEITKTAERKFQCDLLRDQFGAEFGSPGNEGAWLPCLPTQSRVEYWCLLPKPRNLAPRSAWPDRHGNSLRQIAESIYFDKAFDRMPILADAFKEAGCADEAVLNHCHSGGAHVRGCWVLDLALGRE